MRKLNPWLEKIRQFKKSSGLAGMKNKVDRQDDDSDDELNQHQELKKVKVLNVWRKRMIITVEDYWKVSGGHQGLDGRVRLVKEF